MDTRTPAFPPVSAIDRTNVAPLGAIIGVNTFLSASRRRRPF